MLLPVPATAAAARARRSARPAARGGPQPFRARLAAPFGGLRNPRVAALDARTLPTLRRVPRGPRPAACCRL